ncbi:hypothetical protein GCM10011529_01970 [Polymorphobacter glacialis]|uniref:DUF4139 domain-containing protein n=1 Tax=Sandarakinorhabdus glacialis TaxID=1614636 RepID=A0A917E466_9SPHN|nr:hypothetical protein [Polymorphobacter glacialis]GGD99442.1 hypothetical protein GCM10011529_01970 [Polymorphobacter glacialis]
MSLRTCLALALAATPVAASAIDVDASPPSATSVTIYRAPWRQSGALDLGNLGGFALITETRTIRLPVGQSRLRFTGVVGGIQPESAIITGLPNGIIEKNRDAALLSPSALLTAATGAQIILIRTSRATGKTVRTPARIRSATPDGIVFETAEGVQALRCSGVPETFHYDRIPAGLSSQPTLSVATTAARPVTATVTLSYLAQGFDWSADYTATIAADGKTLDLGAWITLANGNGESLIGAQTQIVAGKLNREAVMADAPDPPRVIARCWPQDTTSDIPATQSIELVRPFPDDEGDEEDAGDIVVTAQRVQYEMAPPPAPAPAPAPPPPPEQLGDLKLYRIPQPTNVAARQAKQTRLLDQPGVPFTHVHLVDLNAAGSTNAVARSLIRFANSKADKLGLPLPAGRVTIFQPSGSRTLYVGEASLRDTAEAEDVELQLGEAPDVRLTQGRIGYNTRSLEPFPPPPALDATWTKGTTLQRVRISNAGSQAIAFELRLQTYGATQVTAASHPIEKKDGRPIFRLTLPANSSETLDYIITE